MGLTIAQKIIKNHIVSGEMIPGTEIGLKIDQTLTQDATGTMAYLQFEAMGTERVKTELSVAYIDHNTLQAGFENADDHRYIQTVTKKHGIRFSRPGNGICHQVHLERFGIPGKTLIGSDSHTPTAGGLGMLAMGAGGLDVAVAMGGGAYYINMPKILGVELVGKLPDYVGAKDVILYVLSKLGVKGGVGKVVEYYGEGIKTLSVPERATITNMGAELGATTSVFPSDEITLEFLKSQEREKDFVPLSPDPDATYNETLTVDLSSLVPLAACPAQPRQCTPRKRNRGHEDRSGMYRFLHKLINARYAHRCGNAQRQNGAPRCRAFRFPRFEGSSHNAFRMRSALRYGRGRSENTRMRLRSLHRNGIFPEIRGSKPSYIQPQF